MTEALPAIAFDFKRESTGEQVAGALRELIVTGRLAPGTSLRESRLSNQLGVSRNTVREATQILVSQGLATREMHRGARVKRFGAEDVRDIFRVRRVVELAAVGDRSVRLDIRGLRRAADRLAQAAAEGRDEDVVAADLEFHDLVVRGMDSDRLGVLFDVVRSETRLCATLAGPGWIDGIRAGEELATVARALERRDTGTAARVLGVHLEEAERRLIEGLERREASAPS